ncbi:hypothetical protein [Oricola indica]|jgi:hypothetical protein|uniref:hypothetical protein n=1 Tax=Oricola indica TaxID=2872591 RepID=UPI001CC0F980|nr:hypothetical protein [Oricola indica]
MAHAQAHTANWQPAIERHRAGLLRLVAVLFFMVGMDDGGANFVPRRVWRRILRLLRPAESAVRRLIVVAAQGIVVEAPKPRAPRPPSSTERLQALGLLVVHKGVNLGLARAYWPAPVAPDKPEPRIPAFPLVDPPRRFDVRDWDGKRPFPTDGFELADGDQDVPARHLCRRLLSLKHALDDIETQAKRLARWKARQERLAVGNRRVSPIRRGHPPGRRSRPSFEVDDILRELHALARTVSADTS